MEAPQRVVGLWQTVRSFPHTGRIIGSPEGIRALPYLRWVTRPTESRDRDVDADILISITRAP
jgi:hypothetical protein